MKSLHAVAVILAFVVVFAVIPGWLLSANAEGSFDPLKVDPFMGDYEGTYSATGREPVPVEGKVVPEGGGAYRVSLAGKGPANEIGGIHAEIAGDVADGSVVLSGSSGGVEWVGSIRDGRLHAAVPGHYGGSFDLKHVLRESPTAGQAPPEGAVVVLAYEESTPPDLSGWTNDTWTALPDGSMKVGKGANRTKATFRDIDLHMEFATPYEPEKRGQGRGNSGVYFQERYEIQVLDSFGLILRAGDCGAIYDVAIPPKNACFPPLSWQTYDATFRAPRFNKDGKITEPAWLTVSHNGVQIHHKTSGRWFDSWWRRRRC